MEIEITRPRRKVSRAYGTLWNFWVARSARKANSAQIRLSPALGLVQPSGRRRLVPAEMTRERPAPTWMPLTTGVGITRVNHLSKLVTLKMKTTPAVVKPAEAVSLTENFLDIATAAIAYVTNISSSDLNQASSRSLNLPS